MKKIIILGAAGSVGKAALSVALRHSELLLVVGLHTHSQSEWLIDQKNSYPYAKLALSSDATRLDVDYQGANALEHFIKESDADLVFNAIAGSCGLMSSLWALESGKDLALANKESLVMAGPLLRSIASRYGGTILPVDSEHSAIFYLLKDKKKSDISSVILTASGGALRDYSVDQLKNVTVEDALMHPTWKMGKKISIDSASLANKGLEVIEAFRLFDLRTDQIKVVLHRQSVVHSMVETLDGALYSQMSQPSMLLPIQNSLLYPDIYENSAVNLDLSNLTLTFEQINHEKFPLLNLAYRACELGDPYPICYNAANEVAVEDFVAGDIGFTDFEFYVKKALEHSYGSFDGTIRDILRVDHEARLVARGIN